MKKLLFILLLFPFLVFGQAEKPYRSIIIDSVKALNGGLIDVKDTLSLDSLAVYKTDLSSQYTSRSLVDSAFIGNVISTAGEGIFVKIAGDTMTGNLTTANGVVIKAISGDGTLNLRDGADDAIFLSSDGSGFAKGWLNLDATFIEFGFSDSDLPANNAASMLLEANRVQIQVETTGGAFLVAIEVVENKIGFFSATPIIKPGATNEIKASLAGLGLLTDGGATPLDLDGGTLTSGITIVEDIFSTTEKSLLLGAAATTFAVTSNIMTITGDGGANTIATITGANSGQYLILIFVDGLVTITDDNGHGANTIDLSAAFTSNDDTTIHLIFNGTSWYEISRSAN